MTKENEGVQTNEPEKVAAKTEPSDPTSPPRKRGPGRPPNSEKGAQTGPEKSKPKRRAVALDAVALGKQIEGIHEVVAVVTGMPEMKLASEEAIMLGSSVANVCQQYNLAVDGKTGAFIQLLAAAGMVYVPRYRRINQRLAEQKELNTSPAGSPVSPAAPQPSAPPMDDSQINNPDHPLANRA